MIITSTWKKFTTAALAGRGFALHVQIIGALVRKEVGIRMRMSGCADLATKSNYLLIRSQATRRVVERGKYKEDIVRLLLIQQWEMAMKLSKREGKSVLNMNTAGLELIINIPFLVFLETASHVLYLFQIWRENGWNYWFICLGHNFCTNQCNQRLSQTRLLGPR